MILSMIGFSTGGSAPVLHAVLLRKFAFNLGFQKNHGTLQKQMRVSENGQEAKGDMAWEEEWTCDCEPDPSAEHRREKEKRKFCIVPKMEKVRWKLFPRLGLSNFSVRAIALWSIIQK